MVKKASRFVINTSPPTSFEAAMAELNILIAEMERDNQSLETALAAYARGGELITYCRLQLNAAEQQIQILDGETLKPFKPNEEAPSTPPISEQPGS